MTSYHMDNVTNSMKQSPSWEINIRSACQETWPNFIGREGSVPSPQKPASRLISQLNPINTQTRYFFKIHFNIVLSCMIP
jgi:hypothetical protein